MNYLLLISSIASRAWAQLCSMFCDTYSVDLCSWSSSFRYMLRVWRNCQVSVCLSPSDSIDCYVHDCPASLHLLRWIICSRVFFLHPTLRILPIHTKLYWKWVTIRLVMHACTLDVRLNCFFSLLLAIEDDVARGIIDPFDAEVRIYVKIISDQLITHVVHAKKIPTVRTDLQFLGKIRDFTLVEKFWVKKGVLSSVCTRNSG